MADRPLVSVIMIFWNAEKFLREAVESVFAQNYHAWELLLVDDGSSDASSELARGYAARHPGRVRYLEHPGRQNRGMSASRNLGIRHARGANVTFLDSDDVFVPRALERMEALLASHPEAGAVRGIFQYWYSWTGKPEDLRRDYIPAIGLRMDTVFHAPELLTLARPLGHGSFPGIASVMVRRDTLRHIGGFEENIRGLCEDDFFYIKLYLRASVLVTGECLFKYRQHADSWCATVRRTGDYSSLPLLWHCLGKYLDQQGVKDRAILRAYQSYRRALWGYCHPLIWWLHPLLLGRRAEGLLRRVAGWALGR